MTVKTATKAPPRLILEADTAADLMHPNPVSIRDQATIQEVTALLTEKGLRAAPVIDQAGRPVGVVSRFDIIAHDREKVEYVASVPDYYEKDELAARTGKAHGSGFQVVNVDRTRVAEIMTPVIFAVTPDTPARQTIQEMLALKVHRLFVVDRNGVLVGVISATDVLQHLR